MKRYFYIKNTSENCSHVMEGGTKNSGPPYTLLNGIALIITLIK